NTEGHAGAADTNLLYPLSSRGHFFCPPVVMLLHVRRIDALLLLMTLIWGTNYPIVKHAFADIDPQAFNAMRVIVASAVFLMTMAVVRRGASDRRDERSFASVLYTPTPMGGRDALGLFGLAVVGHCLYQYWFVGGLARTSV